MDIPEGLRRTVDEFGAAGQDWLDQLPYRIKQVEREWSVTIDEAFEGYSNLAWIAPSTLDDGTAVIVKIGIPHRESRLEADALRAYDGQGAVRLIGVSEDGISMLLERCVPGSSLSDLEPSQMNVAAAQVLGHLWEADPRGTFESLTDLAREWRDELTEIRVKQGYDPALLDEALILGVELASTQERKVLLHGDFHPFNVLAAERQPWLAIDPKPMIGDPAYDLAQYLSNMTEVASLSEDPVSFMAGHVQEFAHLLDLDPVRIAGWAYVKSIGWNWGTAPTTLFGSAYRRLV